MVSFATFYSYSWDLLRDWGLFPDFPKSLRMRPHRLYPKWVYYVAIGFDTVARLSWTTTLIPSAMGVDTEYWMPHGLFSPVSKFLFAFIEITRRAVWCLL